MLRYNAEEPCEHLVSPTLLERETTASMYEIRHTPRDALKSFRLISRKITTQEAHPNAAVT